MSKATVLRTRALTQSIRDIAAFQVDGEFSIESYRERSRTQGLTPTGFEALQRDSLEVRRSQERHRRLDVPDARRVSPLHRALQSTARGRVRAVRPRRVCRERHDRRRRDQRRATTAIKRAIRQPRRSTSSTSSSRSPTLRRRSRSAKKICAPPTNEERERFETTEERRARHILIEVRRARKMRRAPRQKPPWRGYAAARTSRRSRPRSRPTRARRRRAATSAGSAAACSPARSRMLCSRCRSARSARPFAASSGFTSFGSTSCAPASCSRSKPCARSLRPKRARGAPRMSSTTAPISSAMRRSTPTTSSRPWHREPGLPLKTLMGFLAQWRSERCSTNSAAVVQAAFGDEIVDSGRNSELVELADDHVLVLRVAAHHVPTTKPLDEVREQIREELTRERAQRACRRSGAGVPRGVRARRRSGRRAPRRMAARGIRRRGSRARMPSRRPRCCRRRSACRRPWPASPQRELVALANGGQAVIVLTGVEAGEPASMTQEERDQRQRQLAEQAARAELTATPERPRRGYGPIPDDILNPRCSSESRFIDAVASRSCPHTGFPGRRKYVPGGSRGHPCARAPR